jgi:CRISPR-associated protein Csb1
MNNEMELTRLDPWLSPDGPVAIVVRQDLEPVEGADAVIFPPTFAPPKKGDAASYVINETHLGKVAIVDTVGSQANRMEPLFKKEPLAGLVPQGVVRMGERRVHILDMGHRAADAMVRYSEQGRALQAAFQAIADTGDATKLAKLAPTSLVFGCWDSRDTQVKLPRIVGSRIRAFAVSELERAAQYFSSFEKEETDELGAALGLSQEALSELGFLDAPAGRSAGGVIAQGGVRRDATLNLIALRALGAPDETTRMRLQRYVLGLALCALLAKLDLYLREGCLLVVKATSASVVARDGARTALEMTYDTALEYAKAAAGDFGVGRNWEVDFSSDAAKQALGATKSAKKKKG